jgi:antitoxin (DNA-binding transcriptional repressor) of toxin-antitoxin stability system
MKAIPVREAQPRLRELMAEACQGELIILTDGEKRVVLEPHVPLDLESDSPESEAELLKAIDGPFAPYSAEEMKAIGRKVLGQNSGA